MRRKFSDISHAEWRRAIWISFLFLTIMPITHSISMHFAQLRAVRGILDEKLEWKYTPENDYFNIYNILPSQQILSSIEIVDSRNFGCLSSFQQCGGALREQEDYKCKFRFQGGTGVIVNDSLNYNSFTGATYGIFLQITLPETEESLKNWMDLLENTKKISRSWDLVERNDNKIVLTRVFSNYIEKVDHHVYLERDLSARTFNIKIFQGKDILRKSRMVDDIELR